MFQLPSLKRYERQVSVVMNLSQREDLAMDVREVVNCQAASQRDLVLRKRLASSPHYWDIARRALHPTTEMVKVKVNFPLERPASWSSGQSLCLLIMRSRVRFPVLPWEFSLKGRIPVVTMVWVG